MENHRKNPIIRIDLNRFVLKAEIIGVGLSSTTVELELYQLDILKLIQFSERCSNAYYQRMFKRFLDKINKVGHNPKINYNRKLPRIYLKDLEHWEITDIKEELK